MPKLYGWSVKRAGGRMTIIHTTGKIAGFDWINYSVDGIVATHKDGAKFLLESPPAAD